MKPHCQNQLIERFLHYTAISSQSDKDIENLPSSQGQMELALVLKKELEDMGLKNIKLTDQAILTALLPGTQKNRPCIGYITHLDTFDGGFSPHVKAQIKTFEGKDIVLNKEKNIVFPISENPEIMQYQGEKIIFSDGTSVLGADDKAAVAVVMTALECLVQENPDRGDIVVAFVPDEEIGLKGAKAMDLTDFPADFAYTLDCCELGEIAVENINAASCVVDIEGVVAHSMSTKGDRVNPILVGVDLINKMERNENPKGREGGFSQREFTSGVRTAKVRFSITEFDAENFENRKKLARQYIKEVQDMYPKAKITYEIKDSFLNMGEGIGSQHKSIDLIYQGMGRLGITPKPILMRGGTDGSSLSHRGIPTPNYFTGAHNFHSNFEFLPITSFVKALELTLDIIQHAKN